MDDKSQVVARKAAEKWFSQTRPVPVKSAIKALTTIILEALNQNPG